MQNAIGLKIKMADELMQIELHPLGLTQQEIFESLDNSPIFKDGWREKDNRHYLKDVEYIFAGDSCSLCVGTDLWLAINPKTGQCSANRPGIVKDIVECNRLAKQLGVSPAVIKDPEQDKERLREAIKLVGWVKGNIAKLMEESGSTYLKSGKIKFEIDNGCGDAVGASRRIEPLLAYLKAQEPK